MICCQYTMHFELKQSTICTNMRDVKTWVSANSIVGKTYDIINVIEDGLGNKLNGISMVIVGFFLFFFFWKILRVQECEQSLSLEFVSPPPQKYLPTPLEGGIEVWEGGRCSVVPQILTTVVGAVNFVLSFICCSLVWGLKGRSLPSGSV